MNKITDSEIRNLFFEFTDDEINGTRYLTHEAFKEAVTKALTIRGVSSSNEFKSILKCKDGNTFRLTQKEIEKWEKDGGIEKGDKLYQVELVYTY